jgi:hypothetical protein
MINIQNISIIVIILYILNNVKIVTNKKTNNKKTNPNNKQTITSETFNSINKNKTYKIAKTAHNMIYGDIQYDVINYDNEDNHYKYQDIDLIKKDKILELSENVNELNKYNDLTKLNNKFDPSQNKFKKQIITNLPCQQDIIYDTKFYQPSDADITNPSDLSNVNYKERKIQEVYDEIVNGNNVNKQNKKKINQTSEFKSGASGLKTFRNLDWEYEGEDDGLSYDPRTSLLSAF